MLTPLKYDDGGEKYPKTVRSVVRRMSAMASGSSPTMIVRELPPRRRLIRILNRGEVS